VRDSLSLSPPFYLIFSIKERAKTLLILTTAGIAAASVDSQDKEGRLPLQYVCVAVCLKVNNLCWGGLQLGDCVQKKNAVCIAFQEVLGI